MTRKYFGTDGIRGLANREPMTAHTVQRLGRALAARLSHPTRKPRVVIGKDTRLSGYLFETALASGVVAQGGDVWLTGPLPTPAIAFLTASMRADAGVVISASHNPHQDNGIKLFGPDGFKLNDALESEIEALIDSIEAENQGADADDIGSATRVDDAVGRYVVFCKHTFPRHLSLDGIHLVVDCAHGAAYRTAPLVFEELGATVTVLNASPNGKNINQDSGALHPEGLCEAVRQEKAHLGIALDGDADRLILVDEQGELLDGDTVLAICARDLLKQNRLPRRTAVATVMSNLGLEHALRSAGGKLIRTQVGDRYVVEAMREGGFHLGGESSGHLIFLDRSSTGDGIIAALAVLEVMIRSEKSLGELRKCISQFPQVLLNVPVANKPALDTLAEVQKSIQDAQQQLRDEGRVLVRYSGTEMKARVMVEGVQEELLRQHADNIAESLRLACS